MSENLMTTTESLRWISEIFESSPENIKETTLRSEILGWDSLGMLSLLAGLDEKFNIQLIDKDIVKLKSIKDILDLLKERGLVSDG